MSTINKIYITFTFDHVFQQELDVARGLTGFVEPHGASNINKASDYSA